MASTEPHKIPLKERADGGEGLRHFTASDGADVAYSEQGEGRPLVFLHGLMANAGFFDSQRDLGNAFRIVAIDLRGHGRSPAGSPAPTIARLSEDVAELAAALELEGAVGVGWSLGAAVLWRVLAGSASRRFAGAVVVDMTPRVLNDDGWDLGLSRETCEARSQAIRDDFPAFARRRAGHLRRARAEADRAAEAFAANDPAAIGACGNRWSRRISGRCSRDPPADARRPRRPQPSLGADTAGISSRLCQARPSPSTAPAMHAPRAARIVQHYPSRFRGQPAASPSNRNPRVECQETPP